MDYSLISWNVNGIRASYKKGFVDWLLKENPDIFCAQETKANIDQLPSDLVNIADYISYFHSAERKGYSGVAVYSKYKPEQFSSGFGDKYYDNEGRTIIVNFKDFILFNVYFPNGQR